MPSPRKQTEAPAATTTTEVEVKPAKASRVNTPPPKSPFDVPRKVHYKEETPYTFNNPDPNSDRRCLNAEDAKEWLGWEQVENSGTAMLTDHYGNKIRLWRNQTNRPVDMKWVEELVQIILDGHWEMNWAPFKISKYRNVTQGQHRLIAMILAQQKLDDPKEKAHWEENGWKNKRIACGCFFVVGVEEDGKMTMTEDFTRPRTTSDVIYCDKRFFAKELQLVDQRIKFCKIASASIDKLWDRTGRSSAVFSALQTPGGSVDFLLNHPSVEEAVKVVVKKDGEGGGKGKVTYYTSLGHAAALLYLMASSKSNYREYAGDRREKVLLLNPKSKYLTDATEGVGTGEKNVAGNDISESLWDKAQGYWGCLATPTDGVAAVRRFIESRKGNLQTSDIEITDDERVAAVLKGWIAYSNGQTKLASEHVKPKYLKNNDYPDGKLDEYPSIGGIDKGCKSGRAEDQVGELDPEVDDPKPDEIAAAAAEIIEDKTALLDEVPAEPVPAKKSTKKPGKPVPLPPEEANRQAVGKKK